MKCYILKAETDDLPFICIRSLTEWGLATPIAESSLSSTSYQKYLVISFFKKDL